MRNAYISALYELRSQNKNIIALVADNGAIVYDKFRKDFPAQFLNVGIAEANMVTIAAGLAACGKIPFVYTIATFLTMRAFEQIRNDIAMQGMNVKLVGIGGGFGYSNLGATHHAIEDLSLMVSIPNMTVFSPADPMETKKIIFAAAEIQGPVYIRLATSSTALLYEKNYEFRIGKGVILNDGDDISVITTGNIIHEVKRAVEEVEKRGLSVRLINLHTLKPIDKEIIVQAAVETGAVLTVEEHTIVGGLGSMVASVILEEGAEPIKFKRLGLKDTFPIGYGSYEDLKELNGLSVRDIKKEIELLYKGKKSKKREIFQPAEEVKWERC